MFSSNVGYTFSFYNMETGEYRATITSTDMSTIFLNFNRETEVMVEGEYDETTYWDGQQVKVCGPKPCEDAVFCGDSKCWCDPRSQEDINTEVYYLNRLSRNKLLTDSDWTQMPDNALTDESKVRWQVYRQELRDIKDFVNPVWPKKPE